MKLTSVNTLTATAEERTKFINDLGVRFPKIAPFLRDAEIDEAVLKIKGRVPNLGPTDVDVSFDVTDTPPG